MENYPDIEEPKKKGFTVGKLFKWLAFAVIAAIYLILIARCSMYSDDKIVSEILVNDVTRAAYQAAPENFTVEQYGHAESMGCHNRRPHGGIQLSVSYQGSKTASDFREV